jgi:hypothetical protein
VLRKIFFASSRVIGLGKRNAVMAVIIRASCGASGHEGRDHRHTPHQTIAKS